MHSLSRTTHDAELQAGPCIPVNVGNVPAGEVINPTFSLREELRELLAWLQEQHEAAVVDEVIAPTRLGYRCLTVQTPDFRLRFIRDQNHLSADAGPNHSSQWYELNMVLEYLSGQRPLAGYFDPGSLQVAVVAGWDSLAHLFSGSRVTASADSLDRFNAMSAPRRWALLQDSFFE
jgi:hypothetical protein